MIYVHVPFCRSFCTYCDFYSRIPCSDRAEFETWAEGVAAEAAARRSEIEATLNCNTLYIGGGTPSVLPLSVLGKVVGELRRIAGDFSEFTVEVNPEDILRGGREYVEGLLGLGVNRISMGVQSLDDAILRWMNRRHDAARAVQAFDILRSAGAENISLDIIFGISRLSDAVLENTLDRMTGLSPEHFSAYQLSIGEESALAEMLAKGRYKELPDEDCERQYRLICGKLAQAGYRHYEISNWARAGAEAVHNGAYWKRLPYVGLGPGAHSFAVPEGAPGRRSWNGVGNAWPWGREEEILSAEDERVERVMLALRTAEGIPEKELRELCGSAAVGRMSAEGLLVPDGKGSLRIPEEHFFISESIIRDLL